MLALYAYPRQNRLLKPQEFQHVFQKPLKTADKLFVFFVRKNENAYARLGLVITKRRFGQAVERNRIRRLIRESFRLHHSQLGGIDIVVLALALAQSETNAGLQEKLNQQWQRLALMHSPKK